MDPQANVVVRGERELVLRAGHLFHAREEFACAAADQSTWALPGARERLVAGLHAHRPRPFKLYNPGALADEESERRLIEIAGHGVRIRICATPLRQETILIDRKVAILAGPAGDGPREYTVVQSPGVVESVRTLFWASWDAATDLAEFRRSRPPALNGQSREIVRLLADGLKDEAAARRLGLSLRTYRRRVAEILTLLDAGSRFQAGLRARELGLA